MPEDESHRRYLIAVGITTDLSVTRPQIIDSVNRMTQIFTDDFGYERVTQLDIDPALDQIRKEIREFCKNRHPDDVVALYYTGHANKVNETHRVWTGNTIDSVSGTLETSLLAELMLFETPLRYAMIILDTCFAAQGGAEALRASISSMGRGDGKTLALLTAAYPREQITAGNFVQLFERAVEQPGTAGHEPRYLTLGAIARVIDADPERPPSQTVSHSLLGARTDLLPFFPNPRFDVQLHGLDLLTQLRIEQRELRTADLRGHFLPRARGVDVPTESGWRFVGRDVALRDLVSWLNNADDLSARVVTGGPGSGKSAVVGRLVVLSDPDWRRTVPTEDLSADTIPPEGSLPPGIHARGLTTAQVLAAVCGTVGVQADTAADLLREMQGRRFTVAIDAVDEALDPPGLIFSVLRPLVEAGPKEGLRLLLGTRPHLLDSLGMAGSAINLDGERYADPASIYQYVVRGLEAENPQSPYHSAARDLIAEVAKAVAEAAGHSFLVALIVSRTLLSSTGIPDPADPAWRAGLPGTAAAAMHSDLQTRLGGEADRARDLLRPLAFAQGAGLPWEDVWASLSSRLSGRRYTDEDLIWLRRQAGSYVVEALESGQSVYRLYHAALAEYLRQGRDESLIHGLFCAFLVDRVPASRSGPDWSRAHPYTLAHLATHAQRAEMLDSLLLDPWYLVNAGAAGLLAALPSVWDADAKLAGQAYQRAVHQLRNQPEDDRLSYLGLASQITHAAALSDRIAISAPHRRWSVPWTHWPPEHPHRILDGHLGLINGVICTDPGDGNPTAVSIGQDARLRIWDVVTTEHRGTYAVGEAPLVAIRAVRLPEGRMVIVLLSADGMLHTWDMSTAALLRTIPVAPLWRRRTRLRNANLTLRCLGTPDGQQFAITGGRGIRTCVWHLSSGRRIAIFPRRVAPEEIKFTELADGRQVIISSAGGAERQLYDLQTGQELPFERRRARFAWLQAFYESLIRRSHIAYYAYPVGPPLVAVRFFRRTAMIWDLTASRPLGIWSRGNSEARIRLTNGRTVIVPLPEQEAAWSFRTIRPQVASGSHEPVADLNILVPLNSPTRQPTQPDRESREPHSPRFEMIDRFLRVRFDDYREKPDRVTISLTLAGHTAAVTGYDWARLPDGHVIVITGSRDGTVRRWDISSITPKRNEGQDQDRVALHRIVSVPLDDGAPVGLTIGDGVDVALWDLRTGKFLGDLEGDAVAPCALGVAHPREHPPVAVTFGADQSMRTWSLPDGQQLSAFYDDCIRWPGDTASANLPDGTCVAITSGHGRRTVVWDLESGRIRNVLAGHRGWSASIACAEGREQWPFALTGGLDNRVNVWSTHHGRRRQRYRIVSRWTFLIRPASGRAQALCAVPLDSGSLLALVATSDGMVRALIPRRFLPGARRADTVPARTIGTTTLSTGQVIVATATDDGVIQIWEPAALTHRGDDKAPLCTINIEVPVSDISFIGNDTFVAATPNGLTAISLAARALESRDEVGAKRFHDN